MAANYWDSTQRRFWQFTKSQLAAMRKKLEDEDQSLAVVFPLPQVRHLNIFFNQRKCFSLPLMPPPSPCSDLCATAELNRLGKRLTVRQQALATAQVYMKRFYCKVEVRRTNPYLVIATALYLACKMEECPQHIRLVIAEAKALWPGAWPLRPPPSPSLSKLGVTD